MPGFAAYERANRASGNLLGFSAIWLLLAVALFGAGIGLGLNLHPTFTQTSYVPRAPSNGAALVQAWGEGDQSVPGEQLNPNLRGLTCRVYNAKRAIVCS